MKAKQLKYIDIISEEINVNQSNDIRNQLAKNDTEREIINVSDEIIKQENQITTVLKNPKFCASELYIEREKLKKLQELKAGLQDILDTLF